MRRAREDRLDTWRVRAPRRGAQIWWFFLSGCRGHPGVTLQQVSPLRMLRSPGRSRPRDGRPRRQVSWLVDRRPFRAFPGARPSGVGRKGSPVTVAGTAADLSRKARTAFPFHPLRGTAGEHPTPPTSARKRRGLVIPSKSGPSRAGFFGTPRRPPGGAPGGRPRPSSAGGVRPPHLRAAPSPPRPCGRARPSPRASRGS